MLGLRSCVWVCFSLVAASRASLQLVQAPLAVASPAAEPRSGPAGSGAQARGLWRRLSCSAVWSLPGSGVFLSLLHRQADSRSPSHQGSALSAACSVDYPLPHRLLITFCACFHSLIHIHRNLLGTLLVPGACARCAGYGASEDPAELVSTSHPPTPTPPPAVPHIM